MDHVEDIVSAHYGSGRVLQRIDEALRRVGIDPSNLRAEDLKPVDEFHTGGSEATEALLEQLTISPETRVLDMGCGIGGSARLIAARHGAAVIGVDLTEEYIAAGRELSDRVGLGGRIRLHQGSVTALPVADTSVDLALLLHVGMNVPDKPALFREAARVLRPGGVFAIFEVMAGPADGPLTYPVPWAKTAEGSFVESPSAYRAAAEAAGFRFRTARDRSDFAREFFGRIRDRILREGPPPIGLHVVMGDSGPEKIGNYLINLEAGRTAPTEMIFDRI